MTSHMALPEPTRPLPRADRLAAMAAFAAAVVLLRLPFARLTRLVAEIKAVCCRRDATPDEAEIAALAAQAAGRWFPGRAACLENSLAAVLTAAARGRAVDWCIGARTAPFTSHAWIQTRGRPAGEPAEADRPYLLLLRI
jgi:hypothetical protein